MFLTVFNGSPRGASSNSQVISNWFVEGYGSDADVHYLNLARNIPENVEAFLSAESILMVFPLYVDGMPGQVKAFIEALLPHKAAVKGKKITFIIHSGFSEGIQCRALQTYLTRFVDIFQLDNHGIVIMPGSEGFRLMPPVMTRKKHAAVSDMGEAFRKGVGYTETQLNVVKPHETMPPVTRLLFKMMVRLGLSNTYWNQNLKKNNAFEKRFDAPYSEGPVEASSQGYIKNY